MKKFIIFIFASLFLFSCSWENMNQEILPEESKVNTQKSEQINVITSIVPIASIANYIWWDKVLVNSLVPAWVSPHGFDMKAEQMIELENSDLVISVWLEHIDWFLDKAIWNKNILKVSEGIELLEWSEDSHENEEWHEEENEEHSLDPHTWTSWENAKIIAWKIKDELSNISPENKEIFEENYENFMSEIDKTINDFKSDINWKTQNNFIIFHDAYNYLFNEIWLDETKKHVFQSNVLSDPSSSEMKELTDEINELNIKTAYKEPQLNDSNLQKLADEYDISIFILDPLWTDTSKDWYISNLENNLENLKNIYE